MAETEVAEVETILREIRERVRAEARVQSPEPGEDFDADAISHRPNAFARNEAHLATLERAWNSLPPVTSNRRGWKTRLELWLKQRLKRATHWFTWEQVNFNHAVLKMCQDTLNELAESEQRLNEMRGQLADLNRSVRTIETEAATRLTSATHEPLQVTTQTVASESEAELKREWQQLAHELRSAIEQLSSEQRVIFKQLALENRETAGGLDRISLRLQTHLAQLEARLEELGARANSQAESS